MFKLFWKRYMELSIRVGAYASALFFNAVIFLPFYGTLKSIVSLIFGIIAYEFVNVLVKRYYKTPSQKLHMSPEDREFRTVNEIRIFQIIAFYFIYVILSMLVLYFYNQSTESHGWFMMLGILGGGLQAVHFFGLVAFITIFDDSNKGLNKPNKVATTMGTIMSVVFMIPQLVYIVVAFKMFFF